MTTRFHKTKQFLKKYFVAHEGNNHHPHFFRFKSIAVFVFMLFAVEGSLLFYIKNLSHTFEQKASIISNSLIAYTNEYRAQEHIAPLERNVLLDKAAEFKAKDMIEKGYFAHFSPEGVSPWSWITKAGYAYQSAGENLAIDFADSKDVVDAWMNSPTHRQNILKQKYSEIGMAVVEGNYQNRKTIFVVQMFATPVVHVENKINNVVVQTPVIASTTPKRVVQAVQVATSSVLGATTSTSSMPIGNASTTPKLSLDTSTQLAETQVAQAPYVAGVSTDDQSFSMLALSWISQIISSPRNTIEVVLYVVAALVLFASLIYVHTSKDNPIHRSKVILCAAILIILLMIAVTMNRLVLKGFHSTTIPAVETSLE